MMYLTSPSVACSNLTEECTLQYNLQGADGVRFCGTLYLYNIIFSTFLQNNRITGSIYNVLNFHWFLLCGMVVLEHY
jgi:hypothetical protein